jgi:hypothetical protein
MQAPPPKNNMLMPVMLIVGAVLILALVGVGVILATSSKGGSTSTPTTVAQASSATDTSTPAPDKTKATPTKTVKVTPTPAPADNTVTIVPDTASCSGGLVTMVLTWTLSSSLPGTTKVVPEVDGTPLGNSAAISTFMKKQADGSWQSKGQLKSTDACTAFGVGDHTIGFQDDTDTIIVEGTFSLTD